jgi:hypothetical protein
MLQAFPHPHFLKTNAKHSRAPLENKLNKRVILASLQVAHLTLPQSQVDPSANAKHSRTLMINKQSVSKA